MYHDLFNTYLFKFNINIFIAFCPFFKSLISNYFANIVIERLHFHLFFRLEYDV